MTATIYCNRPHPAWWLLQCVLLFIPSTARSWTDIVAPKELKIRDYKLGFILFEEDPFLSMETDTQPPIVPTTQVPIPAPTAAQTTPPVEDTVTPDMTVAPTTLATEAPTQSPTTFQTAAPTIDPYPENPIPSNPPTSYFNYDTRRSNPFGPGYPQLQRYNETTLAVGYENNGWASAQIPADFYWYEFDDENGYGPWQGVLARRQPERNRCNQIGEQSPIDVRPSGAKCIEHHEVRSLVRLT
jgi:hypothetical protein